MHIILDYNKNQNMQFVTCKLRWHAKKPFQLFTWKQPTRSPPQRGKENKRRDSPNFSQFNPLHLANELSNYARIHKNVAKTSIQNYKQIEQKIQKIVWRGCEPPPILRLFMKPPQILCSISEFGARSLLPRIALKLAKARRQTFSPYSTSSSDPAAIGWNTSNFRLPWDISVH